MTENTLSNHTLTLSAPIVKYFSIEGLYGYRTVAMSATHSASVLIAKNGSGKTTLLGALDAFLRCQFGRLGGLHFERIVCLLQGETEPLELTFNDVEMLLAIPDDSNFLMSARRLGIEPTQLLDFLDNDFHPKKTYADLSDNEVFSKFMSRHDFNFSLAKKDCEKIQDTIKGRVPKVDKIRSVLNRVLANFEIIYLPTYRRIELSLGEQIDESRIKRKQSIQSKLGLPKRTLFNTEIQFGLSDISERLREMNHELLFRSNQGYREISAKIINDLLDGTFERQPDPVGERPDKQSLTLFFTRLKRSAGLPARFDRVEVPDIEKIYNEGASSDTSDKFLNYFLSKLNEVILATRSIEGRVEDFVSHCNTYLNARDVSTEFPQESNAAFRDEKKLQIDRMSLQVNVMSLAAGWIIPMDSLSSGEKQMISLFAKLYLYDGPKIILIDEPELSLSIDWQKKILIDVVEAPTCSQLIAITHSPFVFDNNLEPYAKALTLKIDPMPHDSFEDGLFRDAEDDA